MKKYIFPFEKLQIWHLAIEMSVIIYKITKDFPSEEKFGLTSEIRRSVNSVSANIAEGSAKFSRKEKARYIEIAFGSLLETASHLHLANRLDFISTETIDNLRPTIEELSNKINSFHSKLK